MVIGIVVHVSTFVLIEFPKLYSDAFILLMSLPLCISYGVAAIMIRFAMNSTKGKKSSFVKKNAKLIRIAADVRKMFRNKFTSIVFVLCLFYFIMSIFVYRPDKYYAGIIDGKYVLHIKSIIIAEITEKEYWEKKFHELRFISLGITTFAFVPVLYFSSNLASIKNLNNSVQNDYTVAGKAIGFAPE
jgi:hypothetical protein